MNNFGGLKKFGVMFCSGSLEKCFVLDILLVHHWHLQQGRWELKKMVDLLKQDASATIKIMQNSESPTLDVARFVKMANRNLGFLEKTLKNTTNSFSIYQQEFIAVTAENTAESVGALIHKMTMSLYYVQAESLHNMMNKYRGMLEEVPQDQVRVQELRDAILIEFAVLIKELQLLDARELLGEGKIESRT